MNSKELSRRELLRFAALGAAAVVVRPIIGRGRAASATPGGGGTPGKFIVILNQYGGNDGINMVVPAAMPSYRTRRPTINLVDNMPVGQMLFDIDGVHKFHYKLATLKQLWDDGDVHIVNKVSYPNPNESHFTSRDIYSFGVRDYPRDGDGRGWLGRFADCYWATPTPDSLGVISVGLSKEPEFIATTTNPLILNSIPGFRINSDPDYANDHLLREQITRNLLVTEPLPTKDNARAIFRASSETYPLVDRVQLETVGWVNPGTYPTDFLGNNMRTISQLLHPHSTWGTQVFYTGYGGFDTHENQHSATGGINYHESAMTSLDASLLAFSNDLKARGLWDDAVILVITEFGRRTYENGSRGTDHGHGATMLAIGGAIKGRLVAGGHTGAIVDSDLLLDHLPFSYDFRDIYGNLVLNHLGLDPVPLFPDPAYIPNFGSVDLI